MGYRAVIREIRRQQRDAQRRSRELEKQAKEQAKLSAIEQAHLEVERFENQLEILLSVHKECGETWDWTAIASALPPPIPRKFPRHEYRARQSVAVLPAQEKEASEQLIEKARSQDAEEFEKASQAHIERMTEWEKLKSLARRILAGEHRAYTETLVELNPFAEIADLGSAIHFTVHTAKVVECVLKVNGKQAIPSEVKALTASGKVSVKPMPKGRFHEIYQDYVCGCVLRVARELFALFPIESILITAAVDWVDPSTGKSADLPVLSVAVPRAVISGLNFDQIHPSDAIEKFQRRGDFKTSRKTETFQPIIRLTLADIAQKPVEDLPFNELLANILRLRDQFKTEIAQLVEDSAVPQSNQAL